MKLFLFAFSVFILSASACTKGNLHDDCSNKTNDVKKLKKMMHGVYTWTRSTFSSWSVNTEETPESTGKTRAYIFNANSTVSFIENGQSMWTYKYDFETNNDGMTFVRFKDRETGRVIFRLMPFLCNDEAFFTVPSADASGSSYYSRRR